MRNVFYLKTQLTHFFAAIDTHNKCYIEFLDF